jgi:hypothetical protein
MVQNMEEKQVFHLSTYTNFSLSFGAQPTAKKAILPSLYRKGNKIDKSASCLYTIRTHFIDACLFID